MSKRRGGRGPDPDDKDWSAIWIAMESRYRHTMAEQLRVLGLRIGETLQ